MCIGAALAALALGLSACGGDGEEPAAAAQTEQEKLREAQVKFAQCMRENGVDLPDPSGDGGTRIQVGPGSDIEPEEFEQASKACEQYRKDIRPQMSEGDREEFKQRALEHARCMREHGIDFPDPQFSAEGGARIQFKPGGGVDPDDPDFKAAQEECGALMGGGRTDAEQP